MISIQFTATLYPHDGWCTFDGKHWSFQVFGRKHSKRGRCRLGANVADMNQHSDSHFETFTSPCPLLPKSFSMKAMLTFLDASDLDFFFFGDHPLSWEANPPCFVAFWGDFADPQCLSAVFGRDPVCPGPGWSCSLALRLPSSWHVGNSKA